MQPEPATTFAHLVEQGVRAYQRAQGLNLVTMTVKYLAAEAAIGVSTLNTWRSPTQRAIPQDYRLLARFATACAAAAPELGAGWVRDLFLEAGMAGYGDQAVAAIFGSNAGSTTEQPNALKEEQTRAIPTGTAPDLPDDYVIRSDPARRLRRAILESRASGGCIAITGMTGAGKSILMTAAAHDPEIQAAFPDGVRWFDAREATTALALVRKLSASLSFPLPDYVEAARDAAHALRAHVQGKRLLICLDDVSEPTPVALLRNLGPGVVILVTTRRMVTAVHVQRPGSSPVAVPAGMTPDEATTLVQRITPVDGEDVAAMQEALRLVAYHPHAIALVARAPQALGMSWTEIVKALKSTRSRRLLFDALTPRHMGLWASLEADWQSLGRSERVMLITLAKMPHVLPCKTWLSRVLWLGDVRIKKTCQQTLKAKHLIEAPTHQRGSSMIHWLINDFVSQKAARPIDLIAPKGKSGFRFFGTQS